VAHFVYIIHSETLNRFYIGQTADIKQRLGFHQSSESRKFTAKANDWILFFIIECKTKPQALAIETHIKKMKSSTYIKNLKLYPEITVRLLEKYKN